MENSFENSFKNSSEFESIFGLDWFFFSEYLLRILYKPAAASNNNNKNNIMIAWSVHIVGCKIIQNIGIMPDLLKINNVIRKMRVNSKTSGENERQVIGKILFECVYWKIDHNYCMNMKEGEVCSYCGKKIGYRNLRRHEKKVHNAGGTTTKKSMDDAEWLQCHHCEKKFMYKRNLRRHFRMIHPETIQLQPEHGRRVHRNSNIDIVNINDLMKKLNLPEPYTKYHAKKIHSKLFSRTVLTFNVDAPEQAIEWLEDYKKKSCIQLTNIGGYTKLRPGSRILYRAHYKCAHNKVTKLPASERKRQTRLNTLCPFKMSIRVITDKTEEYNKCEVTFTCLSHNHKRMHADSMKWNSPSNEVREKFLEMFNDGKSPHQALKKYVEELRAELKEEFTWMKTNRAILPSQQWVFSLYYSEYEKRYGSCSSRTVLEDIEKRVNEYNLKVGSTCMKLIKAEKEFAVVIVTEFMKRVLCLIPQTREVMFTDASGTVERFGSKVLLMMTNSCAGGLPIGVAITSSETTEMLSKIFDTFKSIVPEQSFHGFRAPAGGITDDCDAERESIRQNFPGIQLLLCVFHVLQACWRFIWKADHHIKPEDRHRCITHVKNMMYSEKMVEYAKHFDAVKSETTYPKYIAYVKNLDARKEEWVLFYRRNLPVRGQNTNNICEAAFRVFKERILERLKAYCPQQLIEFIVTDFEVYYRDKLTNIASGRPPQYLTLPKKGDAFFSIEKYDDNIYEVTNLKKNTSYMVYSDLGMCECPVGFNGRYCKHQQSVSKKYSLDFLNTLPTTEEGRLLLFKIADGSSNIPRGFVGNILDISLEENQEEEREPSPSPEEPVEVEPSRSSSSPPISPSVVPLHDVINMVDTTPLRKELEEVVEIMEENCGNDPDFKDSVQYFCKTFKSLRTKEAMRSALKTFGKYNAVASWSKRIPVSVDAVQRRKRTLASRKCSQLGRPPEDSFTAEHGYSNAGLQGPSISSFPYYPKGRKRGNFHNFSHSMGTIQK